VSLFSHIIEVAYGSILADSWGTQGYPLLYSLLSSSLLYDRQQQLPYSWGTQLGLMVFLGKIGADHKCKETKIMGFVVFLGKVEDDVCFFGLLERKMMAGSVFSSFLLVTNESI
jgi:hypothetical protein